MRLALFLAGWGGRERWMCLCRVCGEQFVDRPGQFHSFARLVSRTSCLHLACCKLAQGSHRLHVLAFTLLQGKSWVRTLTSASPGTKQKPGTSWMRPCILAPPCTWHNWQSVREELELGLGWTRGGRLWLVVSGSPFPALPFPSVSTRKGQCTTSSFAANPLCFMANTQSDFFFLGLSWAFFGPASYFFFNMYCIIDSSKFLYFIA